MTEHLIEPRQSWWEKITSEAKAFSPQVKQGIIGVSGALIIAIGGCVKIYSENSRLREKVHNLEQELLPFRNLAVQEFRNADAVSLKKLAELMSTLRADYATQLNTVNALRAEVEQLKKASPQRRQITVSAAQDIIAKLKFTKIKSVQIHTQGEDIDTRELANVIGAVFGQASIAVSGGPILGFFQHGVRVVAKSPNDAALQDAMKPLFTAIGEAPIFQENTALDGTTIQIYVGAAFPR
jgi:hypothetical protein